VCENLFSTQNKSLLRDTLHRSNSRLSTVSQILRNSMRHGCKAKTGSHANKRTDTSGAIQRGSFILPGFGETNAAVPDRINRLLGRKYTVNRKAALWVTAIADLLA